MATLFWVLLGAAIFGWGGYLVASTTAETRRDMHAYARTHHYTKLISETGRPLRGQQRAGGLSPVVAGTPRQASTAIP